MYKTGGKQRMGLYGLMTRTVIVGEKFISCQEYLGPPMSENTAELDQAGLG